MIAGCFTYCWFYGRFSCSFVPQQGEHGRADPIKKAELEQDFCGDNAKMEKENSADKEDARK